jgi:hypothetical protein
MVDPSLDATLAEARATARDQLEAASQIQIGRLMEQFTSGWHAQVSRIFDERMADLDARIQEHHRRAQDHRRRELFDALSQSARRMRQFDNERQWSGALVEATDGLCGRAMLFALNGPALEFRAARNLDGPPPPPVPIASAPAFAGAIETKDTVVALRTRGELSESIANLTGESPDRRCSLFPLVTRDRVAAILYADSEDGRMETSALDLIVTLGASVIDGLRAGAARPSDLLTIFGAPPAPARPTTWAALGKDQQELHLRAQRFARVQVAEMRLYKSQAVKNGRLNADLYSCLKHEIDTGREAFRRDFLSASPSMADYFHLELVQTLANDDAALLGKEYPGPMVASV